MRTLWQWLVDGGWISKKLEPRIFHIRDGYTSFLRCGRRYDHGHKSKDDEVQIMHSAVAEFRRVSR